MKNLIVIIFVLVGLNGFSQGENKVDAKGQKQGEWKKYHSNDMLRYVGNFRNDKPIGEFIYYYDTGEIQAKMEHFGTTSYSIVFYKTGEPKATGKYFNQKKDSTWTYYDVEGYKKASEYYTKGLKNKIWYVYHQNGKIAEEKEYSKDFENGMWNQYFDNGSKKLEATYENGGLEGKAVYYRNSGKRGVQGYFKHGVRHGVWLYFEEDGNKLKKKENYVNGRRVDNNKDDRIIDPEKDKPISEDFLLPENFISPR